MAINSKKDQINGVSLLKGVISNQTRLKQTKEILMSKSNGMVPYQNDTCIFVSVHDKENREAIYINNKLVDKTVIRMDMDIFKVVVSSKYFKDTLHSTFPDDFSEIEFLEVIVAN